MRLAVRVLFFALLFLGSTHRLTFVSSARRTTHIAVQTIEYLETCKEFFERLSLYVNPDSAFCARLSCGGVIEMARAVAEGQIRNGFAIVR